MSNVYRIRRVFVVIACFVTLGGILFASPDLWQRHDPTAPAVVAPSSNVTPLEPKAPSTAAMALEQLPIKGRAAKTGYARTQFGKGWALTNGCSTREIILHRDLVDTQTNEKCQVVSGMLNDPYTGEMITFKRGPDTSAAVQIDHVVALSNAWQTGAQQLSPERREALANDPLELVAVDGSANQAKGDGDAATWLPSNKAFRCQYIARQIAVKQKYELWVTQAEYNAMQRILAQCPGQVLPAEGLTK